jgi:spore coat polysaccharide biosynthesis predicted glycosyltransferase SpsG
MEPSRRDSIKAAFFTEAGTRRGMGHLIRLYTIYKKFQFHNISSSFFLDSDINFDDKFQDITYFKWKEFSLKELYDIVFIDSYEANINIYNIISNNTKVAVYLDDYGRIEYPKGVIINFAPDSNKLFFQNKKESYTYLLGTKYVPIRKEFLTKKINKKKHIFIMLGAYDIKGLSKDILQALDSVDLHKVIIVNNKETSIRLKKYSNTTIVYKPSNTELIDYMSNSMVAISTASMSIYELSYLKIPTIIVAINKNQKIGASQLINNNLAINYIDIEKEKWKEDLSAHIKQLSCNNTIQNIDGNGANRILQSIIKLVHTHEN